MKYRILATILEQREFDLTGLTTLYPRPRNSVVVVLSEP